MTILDEIREATKCDDVGVWGYYAPELLEIATQLEQERDDWKRRWEDAEDLRKRANERLDASMKAHHIAGQNANLWRELYKRCRKSIDKPGA